jgi:uncharacterized delta-60 repeat protein
MRWLLTGTTVACVVVGLNSSIALAAPGDLDPSFGGSGIVTTSAATRWLSVVEDSSGRAVVAGDDQGDLVLARYETDGDPDPTFGPGGTDGDGIVTVDAGGDVDVAEDLTIDASGRIVVAGQSDEDFLVGRLLEDGSPDASFDGDGFVTTSFGPIGPVGFAAARAVTIDANDNIVAAGTYFAAIAGAGEHDVAVARYLPSGALDGSFGFGGRVITDIADAVDLAQGVVVDGAGYVIGGSSGGDFLAIRYLADGSRDATFGGGDGIATTDLDPRSTGAGIARDSRGRFVLAGTAHLGSTDQFALVRYTADGLLDTGFAPGGADGDGVILTDVGGTGSSFAHDLAIDSNGKILAGGGARVSRNDNRFALLRYTANGALDSTFGDGGVVTTDPGPGTRDFAFGLALGAAQKVLLAGTHSFMEAVVARYDDSGAPSIEFSLSVATGGSGTGTVTAPGISCPGDCEQSYDEGTELVLTASATGGSTFGGFSGDCAGASCNLVMNADRAVTATFDAVSQPPDSDTLAPQTRIGRHPPKRTTKRRARFTFSSTDRARGSFECKLDRKRFKPCTSPKKVRVKRGRHKFQVRAIDLAGNTDPSPAKFKWRVLRAKRR